MAVTNAHTAEQTSQALGIPGRRIAEHRLIGDLQTDPLDTKDGASSGTAAYAGLTVGVRPKAPTSGIGAPTSTRSR